MTPQPTPNVSAEDVERVAARDFPSDSPRVLEILKGYGGEDWHREVERVRLAVLKLGAGDVDRLRAAIETARQDYRDVVAAAEYPGYCRSIRPGADISDDERQAIIDADWQQYSRWLHDDT
ncbi:MAG: hypothetical protein PVH89_01470 [Gammaproteobacteria bacterium]|jgi:hypothetical protein